MQPAAMHSFTPCLGFPIRLLCLSPPPAWLRLVCTLHPGFLHGISWYRWDGKKRPICGLRFKRYLTERRSAPCSEGLLVEDPSLFC